MGMIAAPVRLGMSAAAAPADVDTLDVDVDLDDWKAEGSLDRITDRGREIVGDLRDPGAVLDDDEERDGDPVLADVDLDAPMEFVAVQSLGQAVA
jgi:hypothetical protein